MSSTSDTLDLGSMLQPLAPAGVFSDPGYFVWDSYVFRDVDRRHYMVYSRWPKHMGFGAWLTDSEIALAAADRAEGPYQHVETLLKGRGGGHWDELMAHNPKIKRYGDSYYLYYISSRSGPTRGHVRDSQRIGVAVAEAVAGPYERFDQPLVAPAPPAYNVAVDPGVTQTHGGRYLLIFKGDIKQKLPSDPMPQRIQALAIAESPTGPFAVLPRLAIADTDTEDASIWYDPERQLYNAVFHAHTYIGLIVSVDGLNWERATHYQVTGKCLALADGSSFEPDRLERPSVFLENGQPRLLCLSAKKGEDSFGLLVPLG